MNFRHTATTTQGLLILIFSTLPLLLFSQTILEADGPGDTYELINSVLAPGNNVMEVPDCNHTDFGDHVDELFDEELDKFVFRFYIHTTPDNDRCINFDRQRNEIKAYDQSPDYLKGVIGEEVVYKWKFKLDESFQPSSSFTHIHQLKAVGGTEASLPLITLTPRRSSPDRLELRYTLTNSQSTLTQTALAPFLGEWLEVTETVLYGEVNIGEYQIVISNISTGEVLFEYANDDIRMWKTGAQFVRPKWGIYRSLNDSGSLRDEQVLFADFSIEEVDFISSAEVIELKNELFVYPNPANDVLQISNETMELFGKYTLYSIQGQPIRSEAITDSSISIASLDPGIYFIKFLNTAQESGLVKVVKK